MNCPNCQNQQVITEHNYGALYTCSSCQAVYFINFEGQPEFGEITPLPEEIGSVEPLVSNDQMLEPISNVETPSFADNAPTQLHSMETLENPFDMQSNLNSINSDVSPLTEEIQPVFAPPPLPPEVEKTKAPAAKKETKAAPAAPFAAPMSSSNFADIAQEISDFANTDSQLAGLNYDLVITGIDTLETKNLFKEAIEDSKFAWDSTEIMKSLKNGRVELNKLSPAKAFLLAKRIQFLDIEKIWKQNVLS